MRAFYAPANKNYELKPDNFSKEDQQHKWVETNLQLLFPSLELVESKPRIASKIPDTVAYDRDANTFVAIEYKNRRSDTVREQAEDYLIKMKSNHGELASRYNDRPNVTHRTSDSFDWERMYVVIIAPEFTDRQVSVADHRDAECLYELKRFESGFVTLRFVGGKHGPIDAPKPPIGPSPTPLINLKDYEAKYPFYAVVRDRILRTFPEVKEFPTTTYVGFRRPGERLLCTVEAFQKKVDICYGRKGDFDEDDFTKDVANIGHQGSGDYRSYASNEVHLKRLLPILKKMDRMVKSRS